jgi:hypothetical protein
MKNLMKKSAAHKYCGRISRHEKYFTNKLRSWGRQETEKGRRCLLEYLWHDSDRFARDGWIVGLFATGAMMTTSGVNPLVADISQQSCHSVIRYGRVCWRYFNSAIPENLELCQRASKYHSAWKVWGQLEALRDPLYSFFLHSFRVWFQYA